ncbi:hypothetical protein J3E69DRAFT_331386, partial [Trichoderma sp. SZMC 28015]
MADDDDDDDDDDDVVVVTPRPSRARVPSKGVPSGAKLRSRGEKKKGERDLGGVSLKNGPERPFFFFFRCGLAWVAVVVFVCFL